MARGARRGFAALAALAVACSGGGEPARETTPTVSFERDAGETLRPLLDGAPLEVRYGARADVPVSIRDARSGLGISFALDGATRAPAEVSSDGVVYRRGHSSGADVVQRVSATRTEDHLRFARETTREVTYTLTLGPEAKALRSVAGFLEVIDRHGMPRLRMEPPWVADATSKRHAATTTIERCAVDRDPRPPWGRPLPAPGASSCTVRVSWEAGLPHPLVLDPAWKSAGVLAQPRSGHSLTELDDGTFLIVGGGTGMPLVTEIYHPPAADAFKDVGSFAIGPKLPYPGEPTFHTATRLPGGKVLVYGGLESKMDLFFAMQNAAALYDPGTGSFQDVGAGQPSRSQHTASLLPDGRVLLAGGTHNLFSAANDTAYYTAGVGFSPGPNLTSPRAFHAASTLLDGSVLLTGGSNGTAFVGAPNATSDRLAPGGTSFQTGPTMSTVRAAHTSTLLPDGRVLVVGGADSLDPRHATGSVDIYTPNATGGTFTPLTNLDFNRALHTTTLLADGRLLIAAGIGGVQPIPNSELYTVTATGSSTVTVADPISGRGFHATAWLGGLRALATGGTVFTAATDSAVMFDRYPVGIACDDAGDCDSGFCTDGVCCEKECTGACEACTTTVRGTNLPDGTCGPIVEKAAARAGGTCVDVTAQNPCGDTGTCDGKGGCRKKPLATACGAAVCEPPNIMIAACDGNGSCTTLPNCGYYANCASPTACETSCTKSSDCVSSAFCGKGECRKKGDLGESCEAQYLGADCSSGHCVDGLCCSDACDGLCRTCRADQQDAGGKDGVCGAVKAGADPREDCPKDPPSSCQSTGVCDGKGACERYGSTVVCGAGSTCSSDAMGGPAAYTLTCNGGACLPGAPTSCGGFACNATSTACNTDCATNAECAANAYCGEGAKCVAQKSNGAPCKAAKECVSGVCAEGVCCTTACAGQCESCVTQGAVGTCVAVVGPAPEGKPACSPGDAKDVCTATRCDGVTREACKGQVGGEVECSQATCKGDVLFASAACGAGHCKEPVQVSCAPYGCEGAACKSACASDADCSSGARCEGGVCTAFATCIDPTTLRLVDGTTKSCAPFECDTDNRTCRTTCSASTDCAKGSVCLANGQCGAGLLDEGDVGGCSVGTGGGRSRGGLALGAFVVLGALLRRLRKLWPVPLVAAAACAGRDDGPPAVDARSPPPSEPARVRAEALLTTLPDRADGALSVRDAKTKLGVEVRLSGARSVPGRDVDGARIFQGAHAAGSMLVRRAGGDVEDFVSIADARTTRTVRYDVRPLDAAGLRLVDDVLEVLDEGGAPRIRANRPWVADATGRRHPAHFDVEGCNVDRSPRAPWGRPTTPPGAEHCTLVVTLPELDGPVLVDPGWSATSDMTIARGGHGGTVLASGLVLVAGGADALTAGNHFSAADLFDPATGTFAATGAMPVGRGKHIQLRLPDDRVLAFGGETTPAGLDAPSPVYDPSAGTWSNCGSLPSGRYSHTGVLLQSGKVLVAGGFQLATNLIFSDALVHDASTCTWAPKASMGAKRRDLVSGVLPDGRVIVGFGAVDNAGTESLTNTTEIYDPVADAWSPGPNVAALRRVPALFAVPTGFLVAGGVTGLPVKDVEIYSFASNTWTAMPPLLKPRIGLGGAYVPSLGRPLVTAGYDAFGAAQQSELFDAGQNKWLAAGLNTDQRAFPSVNLLPDGRVLVAGGGHIVFGALSGIVKTAEVFSAGALGDACTGPGACGSGFCVDGVCCDKLCNGACEACSAAKKGQGQDGSCGFVQAGADPDSDCVAQDPSTCGTDGTCDGAGQCKKFTDGTSCASSCIGGIISNGTCGGGSCVVSQTSCLPYACKNGGCLTSCVTAAECAPGSACVGGTCTNDKQPKGSACIDGNTCQSGHCVDGVCCDTKCGEACRSCKASEQDPSMSPVDGECKPSAPSAPDPHDLCVDTGPQCKSKGVCAKGGACLSYQDGDTCFPSACSGSKTVGYSVSTFTCKGGQCTTGKPAFCGFAGCASGACLATCKDDGGCTATARCVGGKCEERSKNGKACGADVDCLSGFCTDGVCCLSRCDAQCSSCNEKGQEGICLAVSGAPRGARIPCSKGETTCSAKHCDGVDPAACTGLVGSDVVCRPASCADDRETYQATCNGKGQCGELVSKACAPFACGDGKCKTSCTTSDDCVKGSRCTQGTCVALPTCDGSTLKDPDGTVIADCGLYRCNADEGNCRTTCTSTAECAKGATCNTEGVCEAAAQEGEVDAGCGCDVPGRRRDDAPFAALALALALTGLAARRR